MTAILFKWWDKLSECVCREKRNEKEGRDKKRKKSTVEEDRCENNDNLLPVKRQLFGRRRQWRDDWTGRKERRGGDDLSPGPTYHDTAAAATERTGRASSIVRECVGEERTRERGKTLLTCVSIVAFPLREVYIYYYIIVLLYFYRCRNATVATAHNIFSHIL